MLRGEVQACILALSSGLGLAGFFVIGGLGV